MLPKAKRFKTEDFKEMRKMHTVHTPHFFIRFCEVPLGQEKTAVIVSSSTYKKAVDRNKLRRRMYHLVAEHASLRSGKALSITFKKGALGIPFRDIGAELQRVLVRKSP
ncbi:MAG: ribonuclease P protein component [Candidatus Taylorbacteria bacterium]|nr:ribonuclease P protein component [Candidatus Taylorbacteria bacterium]